MTSHCTYAAHYEKAPKKGNINNFKKDVCFGWIGRKHTDTEKHSGVIHYMAIQKNVQYGSFSSTLCIVTGKQIGRASCRERV